MLHTNFWQNKGMSEQPIWVYKTEEPDGKLGEAVGNICAISDDMKRHYLITSYAVAFQDFWYYADTTVEGLDEDGTYKDNMELLLHSFVQDCEEVFTSCRAYVYFKDVADNMMSMSERLGLGWVLEESYDADTYEQCWTIYSAEFAKKAHIGQNAIYCYTEEALSETVQELAQEGYIVEFSSELEECYVMIDADGNYEIDEAYVVTWEEPQPTVADKLDKIEQRLLEIDAIWEGRDISDATAEPEWSEYENLLYLQAEILIREEV